MEKYDLESILEMYDDDYQKVAEVPRSEMDNFNTPDLEQAPDSYLKPGETLEDFDVTFRRPNAQGGRIPFAKAKSVQKMTGFEKMNLERRLKAYNELKDTYGKKIIEEAFENQFGTSFENIADKKEYKGRTVTNIIDGFKKKIKGVNRSSNTSPIYNPETGHIYKTSNRFGTFYSKNPGKNQYAPMRSLEEVQKAIDNAPPIEIDGKFFEQNKKDLRGDSEFSGKEVVTRKEQDKYGDKLKYKSTGKKRIVLQTQAYYDRRARELAKSNPTILKKISGKDGLQLSHLSLSELDTLKNLGYLPAEINLKQYFPFEKKIVEISQQIYETQNDPKLSIQEKRDKIAELQKKDRALRKKYPEFAKTKARLNVRATGLDASGLMIKEKLPDPSIAIAPDEAGTQLKGTTSGSDKGKELVRIAKENLQKKTQNQMLELAATVTDKCKIDLAKGGRIGFASGRNYCLNVGKQALEKGLKTGFPKNQQVLAEGILKAGRSLKDIASLRGLFGPAALAFTAVAEAGFIGYDMLSSGKSFKEAVGGNLFNYLLGDKTKIDLDKEIIKRLRNIPGAPSQGFREFSEEDIGKMQNFKAALKEMSDLNEQFSKLDNINKQKENLIEYDSGFSEGAFKLDKEEDLVKENIQDFYRSGGQQRLEGVDYLEGAKQLARGNLLAKQDQLLDAGIGKFYQSPKGDERRIRELNDIRYQLEKMQNPSPYEGDEFAQYFVNAPQSEQSYMMGLGYSEGGIASLKNKKPTNTQKLAKVYKNPGFKYWAVPPKKGPLSKGLKVPPKQVKKV